MYKITCSILLIILACTALATAFDRQVPYATTPPIIDANGETAVSEWDGALTVSISYPELLASGGTNGMSSTTPTHADLSANFKILWDENNLYIYARVYDDSLRWRSSFGTAFNDQDCFQVLFNFLNDPNAEFLHEATIFDITADTSDGYGAAAYAHGDYQVIHFVMESEILSDGWQMEVAIPWVATFHRAAYPGDRHGFSLTLVDYDGLTTPANFLLDFGNGSNTISDISTWNTITLIGPDGCGANGRFIGDISGDCYVDLADFALMAQQWGQNTMGQD